MTDARAIIRAAIPDADDGVCEVVLWGRTPFPFAPVSARELYRAAHGLARANRRGVQLCDFCPRPAGPTRWLCALCEKVLARERDEGGVRA